MSIDHEKGAEVAPQKPLVPPSEVINESETEPFTGPVAHSGTLPIEAGGKRPVDTFKAPLSQIVDQDRLGPEPKERRNGKKFLIAGAAALTAVGATIAAVVSAGHGHSAKASSNTEPTAASSASNPAQSTSTSPSVESSSPATLSPSAVPTPSELNYYSGEGNINTTRMLPGDKTYEVHDGGNTIVLPAVRPVTTSSTPEQLTDSANSVLAQLSYYLKTNDENVAQQVLDHLTASPDIQTKLAKQRKINQNYRTQHGVTVEISDFEDSASAPATFALNGADLNGSPVVSMVSGDLKIVNFTGFKVTDMNGNIQNSQTITAFRFGVDNEGKITSYTLNYAS